MVPKQLIYQACFTTKEIRKIKSKNLNYLVSEIYLHLFIYVLKYFCHITTEELWNLDFYLANLNYKQLRNI
jgi:hypothetical protein